MDPTAESPRRPNDWRGAKNERRRLIEEARQACDADGVLALIEGAPGNLPNLQEILLWARLEKQRQAQLHYAWRHRSWDRVLALLDAFPPHYPNLEQLREEALAAMRHDGEPDELRGQPEAVLPTDRAEAPQSLRERALVPGDEGAADAGLPAPALVEPVEQASPELTASVTAPSSETGDAAAPALMHSPSPGEGFAPLPGSEPEETESAPASGPGLEGTLGVIDGAGVELAAGNWSNALLTFAGLPAIDVMSLAEPDRARLVQLVLEISSAADAASACPAAEEALGMLTTWGIPDEQGRQRLAQIGLKREAERLVTVAEAALVAGNWQEALEKAEAAGRAWPGFPRAQDLADLARRELDRDASHGRPTANRAVPTAPRLLDRLVASVSSLGRYGYSQLSQVPMRLLAGLSAGASARGQVEPRIKQLLAPSSAGQTPAASGVDAQAGDLADSKSKPPDQPVDTSAYAAYVEDCVQWPVIEAAGPDAADSPGDSGGEGLLQPSHARPADEGIARHLIAAYPSVDTAYCWLAHLYGLRSKFVDASDVLDEGLAVCSRKRRLCHEYGWLELEAGCLAEAAKWWLRAASLQVAGHSCDDYEPFLYLAYLADFGGLAEQSQALLALADGIQPTRPSEAALLELRALADQTDLRPIAMAIVAFVQRLANS